jgi:hypothetical protein
VSCTPAEATISISMGLLVYTPSLVSHQLPAVAAKHWLSARPRLN